MRFINQIKYHETFLLKQKTDLMAAIYSALLLIKSHNENINNIKFKNQELDLAMEQAAILKISK